MALPLDLLCDHLTLGPQVKPKERRLRCIGHIINLVAKAFLFDADHQHYEFDNDSSLEPEDIKKTLAL